MNLVDEINKVLKVINELEKKTGIEIFKEKQILTKNDILQWQ